MVDRFPGPWPYYPVHGEDIRAAASATKGRVAAIDKVSNAVDREHKAGLDAVEGELESSMANAPRDVVTAATQVQQRAIFAAGTVDYFARAVDAFDTSVSTLNVVWFSAKHDPSVRGDAAAMKKLKNDLDRDWASADKVLDDEAGAAARMLNEGDTEENVKLLARTGALPPYAPVIWKEYTFTAEDAKRMIAAKIQSGEIPDSSTMTARELEEWLLDHPEYGPLVAAGLMVAPKRSDDRDDLSLEQIKQRYKVPENTQGTEEVGFLWITKTVEKPEADVFNELSLLEQKDFKDIQEDALKTAEARFPGAALHNDQADAFRHAYWNALLTQRFGADYAKRFTDAHESKPGQPGSEMTMDLYNNELGREVAGQHPDASPDEIAGYIQKELESGRGLVLNDDGEIARSDADVRSDSTGTHDSYGYGTYGGYDYGGEPETGY